MCELVVARTNASVKVGERGRRVIRKGTVLCADDPMVAGRDKLFQRLEVTHYCKQRKEPRRESVVEQATAAPGEKRNLEPSDTRAIREWAAAHGYDVAPRGRIPDNVVEAYQAAQAADAAVEVQE